MADKNDRLTLRAKKVLAHATNEARDFGHNYVGTEHFLLGITRERAGVGALTLQALDITEERLRDAVAYVVVPGDGPMADPPKLVPRAYRALDLAAEEADRLNHRFIGTEHLLLGLLLEEEGIAAGILAGLGVTIDAAREQVMRLLGAAPRGGVKSRIAGALRERQSRGGGDAGTTRGNVITVRVTDADLAAIDALVESGIRTTRSDAAAWLIGAGIGANGDLLAQLNATIEQIRHLRASAQALIKE